MVVGKDVAVWFGSGQAKIIVSPIFRCGKRSKLWRLEHLNYHLLKVVFMSDIQSDNTAGLRTAKLHSAALSQANEHLRVAINARCGKVV